MIINCNDIVSSMEEIFVNNNRISLFSRGSSTYGTMTEYSDNDIAVIVDNDTVFIDQPDAFVNDKSDKRIHQITLEMDGSSKTDIQFVKECDFIDMIKEHTPFALEAIFLNDEKFYGIDDNKKNIVDYKEKFVLDKLLLRESFGSVSNNSFAKAKKKMTVKKDLDLMCGAKSLFHSIRLLMFACQIAENGHISDYLCSVNLYRDIMNDLDSGYTWDNFNEKYKPLWKEWHSKLVKVCPKPRGKYKTENKKEQKTT